MDLDVLEWWKARDHKLPEDLTSGRPEGLPLLARMARHGSTLGGRRPRRLVSSACSAKRAGCMTTSRPRSRMTHWSTLSWLQPTWSEESRRHCMRGFFERCARRDSCEFFFAVREARQQGARSVRGTGRVSRDLCGERGMRHGRHVRRVEEV